MLNTFSKEATAYDALYSGKTAVLKISGGEVASNEFPKFVQDVRWLTEKNIRIVIDYGGGDQISEMYKKNTGKGREKIDGIGVTTYDVLQQGVIPAYWSIREKFKNVFPDAHFVEPHELQCNPHTDQKLGLVGVPQHIVLPKHSLSIVGFLGQNKKDDLLNVNADDIPLCLAGQQEVHEVMFVTGAGGVKKKDETIASFLTDERMKRILNGEDREIVVNGGMKKKLEEALRATKAIGKIVITNIAGVRNEIERWRGDGTLCADSQKLEVSPMRTIEEPIIDAVIEEMVRLDIFRKREPKEWTKVKNRHHILRIGDSPLGGVSVIPKGEKWAEVSALWANPVGNGLGQRLLLATEEIAEERRRYGLTTEDDAVALFNKSGMFQSVGYLREVKRRNGIPEHLRDYDTSERNPQLFIEKE